MERLQRVWLPAGAGLTILATDLLSKEWALRALAPVDYGPRVPIIPGCLDFLLRYNTGGAFSILRDKPWIITAGSGVITLALIAWFIARFVRNIPPMSRPERLAFGLILGGALGNLVDRVRFQYVVDFIHAYINIGEKEYYWPTFNIADAGIVVGIGLFLYISFFTTKLDPPTAKEEPA